MLWCIDFFWFVCINKFSALINHCKKRLCENVLNFFSVENLISLFPIYRVSILIESKSLFLYKCFMNKIRLPLDDQDGGKAFYVVQVENFNRETY